MWRIAKPSASSELAAAAVASQDHSTRATVALQKLVEIAPAFGSLSMWCKHRDATPEEYLLYVRRQDGADSTIRLRYDLAPAYTDGETIYYGATFAEWTLEEQVAVCAHEIMHIACRHLPRGRALKTRLGARYSHALFNIATDAIINETLALAKHQLPKGGVSLAEVLKVLPGQNPHQTKQFLNRVDAETLYMMLSDTLDAGGPAAEALRAALQDRIGDMAVVTSAPADAITDAAWETRLKRALVAGQNAGRGLGVHALQLADLPRARVPWEIVLRRLTAKAVTQVPQPTYARPARRWLAQEADAQVRGDVTPAYIPGSARTISRPVVAVCLDVSGSIGKPLLDRFGAEIAGLGKRTGAELHLIVFDDGIQLEKRLDGFDLQAEIAELRFKGGGGTSFVQPIAAAVARKPSAIVVLTDLCGPFGEAPLGIPVIWACPQANPGLAPFGRVVSMAG